MATRTLSSIFRQIPRQNSCTHIRKLTVQPTDKDFNGDGIQPVENFDLSESLKQHFIDITRNVAEIIGKNSKSEQIVVSDFASLDFNAAVLVKFFHWLRSNSGFLPDPVSCNVLFRSLLDAKALVAAKCFLEVSSFTPEKDDLERFICCLCKAGLIDDAIEVFAKCKDVGLCPSIGTWNSALLGCLNVGRTDLVWKLYTDMMELGVLADIDVDTVEYLIRAFCSDGEFQKGYELLRQVLESGFVPGNIAFNALISGFCNWNYDRVSELLHIMIAKNRAPDIDTYQEIIRGLWKSKMSHEAIRIFYNLKDRGYAPNVAMYTTMINGLCQMGRLSRAWELWDEMISKGILPNQHTYDALIHGLCKKRSFKAAMKLFDEMRGRDFEKTTASYNMMISNLCSFGKVNEAFDLFEEMLQKGIARNAHSYSILIKGFCKPGKIEESKSLLNELLAHGLQPSIYSYSPLIDKLCQAGNIEEARKLWNDMQNRGLKPLDSHYDQFIIALCEHNHIMEAMEWLIVMFKNKLRPKDTTFHSLLLQLLESDMFDESLDFMLAEGYSLNEDIWSSLVSKLCKGDFVLPETFLDRVLERN
ncbi:Pentatricopeptide repeat (PPR) superfamily protein [Euphorbia peplus]|nr:Pentatricopeptide repeat (PPR) superfamily protein [Euphorbia peplus]